MTVTLPPQLAGLLQQAGGHWPEADEDQLATIAAGWRDMATTLDTMREDGNRMAGAVTAENRGASIDAFSGYWSANLDRHLTSATTAAEQSAVAVEGMAKATLSAKSAIVRALSVAQQSIAQAESAQNVAIVGPLIGGAARAFLGPLLRLLAKVLGEIIKFLIKIIWELIKLLVRAILWIFKKIIELFKKLFKQGKQNKPKLGKGVKEVPKKPLTTSREQIEAKYKHAKDFGINEPRGKVGFDKLEQAVKNHVDDSATMHIGGTYRGQPAILNYNPNTGLVVVQKSTGEFVSGWRPSPAQIKNMLENGKLGGG
ncbi:MAG: colicin D domain-containing protein [Pseudonocardiaceae bacterium]